MPFQLKNNSSSETLNCSDYFVLQTDWLHENLCVIYKEVANVTDCDGSQETLLALVGLSLWDKMVNIEVQGESLKEEIQMYHSTVSGALGIGSSSSPDTAANGLESSRMKVDANEVKMDEINNKVDAVERKIDLVEDKLIHMEGNIEAMKDKVNVVQDNVIDAVEGKIDAVEDRLSNMEGNMKEMMSMMMELLATKEG